MALEMSGVEFFDRACELQAQALSQIKEGIMKMHSTLLESINERDKIVKVLRQVLKEKESLAEKIKVQAKEIKLLKSERGPSSSRSSSSEESCTTGPLQPTMVHIPSMEPDGLHVVQLENEISVKGEVLEEQVADEEPQNQDEAQVSRSAEALDVNEDVASQPLHETEKGYHQCKFCSDTFAYPYELKAHLAKHTGEKPYKCEFCGAGFLSSSNRNQHRVIHTEEKRHQCEYCSKRFKHYRALRQHYRIHTGEKPFKCPHCASCFTQSGHLQSHLRIHMRKKGHKCSYCSGTFFSPTNLLRHMRSHHSDVVHTRNMTKDLVTVQPSGSEDSSEFGEVLVVPLSG